MGSDFIAGICKSMLQAAVDKAIQHGATSVEIKTNGKLRQDDVYRLKSFIQESATKTAQKKRKVNTIEEIRMSRES